MRKPTISTVCLFVLFFFSIIPSVAYVDENSPHLYAVVTASSVNVHSSPALESQIVGRVWHGVRMKIYELQAGWVLVEFSNGKRGWVQSDYIETLVAEKGIVAPKEPPLRRAEIPESVKPYRIKVGDTILIKSFNSPDINDELVVRPDGCISPILLDDVYVVGFTPSELDSLLTSKYKKYLKDPELTITLNKIKEVMESRVFVGGEVANPQELPMQVPITVLQAITSAGGFLDTAKSQNVILIRKGEQNKPIIYSLNLHNIEGGEAIRENIYLQPFDMVYVPATTVGEVGKFVDQHINKIVPRFLTVGFSWFQPIEVR